MGLGVNEVFAASLDDMYRVFGNAPMPGRKVSRTNMGLGFGSTSTSCSAPSLAETCAGTEQRSGVNVWESMCADMCDYVLPLHSIHSKTSNLYIDRQYKNLSCSFAQAMEIESYK